MTDEHRLAISNSLKGKMPKFIPDNKGRKHGFEWTKKQSDAHRGKKWGHHSKESKEKIGESNLGKNKGKIGHWRGKKRPTLWKGGKARKSWWTLQRIIKKRGNGGSHTFEEWELLKAQYNWTCPCCKKPEPEIKLTEDHVVAVSKGGSNNIENIQPLCGRCNSSKQTKEIRYEK